jgi:hypothetical protein
MRVTRCGSRVSRFFGIECISASPSDYASKGIAAEDGPPRLKDSRSCGMR